MSDIFIYLALALLNALAIIGFFYAVEYRTEVREECEPGTWRLRKREVITDKNILWRIKYYGDRFLPYALTKPLYNCTLCMASVHSVYVYWVYFGLDPSRMAFYPAYMLAVAGLTFLLHHLIPD